MSSVSPVLFLFFAALSIWEVNNHHTANKLALGAAVINFIYFAGSSLIIHLDIFRSSAAFALFSKNQYGMYSEPFVLLFSFILVPLMIHNLSAKNNLIQAMTLAYAAASIACVTSDNMLAFLVAWELGAIASMFLVATGGNRFRNELIYFSFHFLSGLLLLAGTVLQYQASGSLAFPHFANLETVTAKLFFLAFGIKVGFPVFNLWLFIAYPNAEPRASAALSIFSTKIAIYGMLMMFSGLQTLTSLGLFIAVFHTLLAWFCVHYRTMLTHALNAQLGIMIFAIGIGTNIGISTAILMVIGHVLYKTYAFIFAGTLYQASGSNSFCALVNFEQQKKTYFGLALLGAVICAFPLSTIFVAKEYLYHALHGSVPERFILLITIVNAINFGLIGAKPIFSYFIFPGKKSIMYPAKSEQKALASNTILALLVIAGASLIGGLVPGIFKELLPVTRSFPIYTTYHVLKQLITVSFIALLLSGLFYLRFTPWVEHALAHARSQRLQTFRFAHLWPFLNNLFVTKHVIDLKLYFWVGRRKRTFMRYFGLFTNQLLVMSRMPSSYLALWIISSLAICILTLNLAFL